MANKYSEAHICSCLTRISTLKRNSTVAISGNNQKSGQEFVHGVLSLANGLVQLGLSSGDVVAISAFNSDLYLEWLLAVAFLGGIIAPLNYRWTFGEARSAMLVVKPVMLVTDESCSMWYSEFQRDAMPYLKWHVFLDEAPPSFSSKLNAFAAETLKKRSLNSVSTNYSWATDGAVLICFTSGTTGRPKGVIIGHSALIMQSLAKIAIIGYSEDDIYLHTAPLCHIGGLSSAIAMLMVGACHVFMPKFTAKAALEAIVRHKVTSLITVPTMMADLISLVSPENKWNSGYVKKILNGGGSLSHELIKDIAKFFPRTKLFSAYGMTEACSSLTFMTLYDPGALHEAIEQAKSKSLIQMTGVCVGKPAPHVEIKICIDGPSNIGKILTRGPHVMLGYWNHTAARASSSSNDAWLETGDVGFIDDNGNLWLIGRANGRIKTGGENVYPEEVEASILQHPGVTSVVVLGIPDARLTEKIVACVQLKENWQWSNDPDYTAEGNQLFLSNDILRNYCREINLTGFKIPKVFILWRKPFPLTTTGKIKREQLRKEVMDLPRSFSLLSHL